MVEGIHFTELRDAALFRDLSDEVLAELASSCRYRELLADEQLFVQGDESDALYVLQEGQVHVLRSYPDGEQVILATESPYYIVGELSMLANQPRTGTVVAVSDCELLEISRDDFEAVCHRHPEVAVQMMEYLGQRLYRMNLMVREYALGNVAARVATLLLLMATDDTSQTLEDVRVSRLARAAATDADKVQRVLTTWSEAGYVELSSHTVRIMDVDAIEAIAG